METNTIRERIGKMTSLEALGFVQFIARKTDTHSVDVLAAMYWNSVEESSDRDKSPSRGSTKIQEATPGKDIDIDEVLDY
jgi:hypothetical protein